MPRTFVELVKRIWHDPVGSKLIAASILGIGGIVGVTFWGGQHEAPRTLEKQFTDEELGYRNLAIGKCEKPQDVPRLYAIARALPTKAQQDAEFSSLVVEAVCANDERLALEIFTTISDPSFKDMATRHTIAKYMRDKKYEDANRWVKRLSNSQDRDWWIRRILESKRNDG